jgi:hypothetical protein
MALGQVFFLRRERIYTDAFGAYREMVFSDLLLLILLIACKIVARKLWRRIRTWTEFPN